MNFLFSQIIHTWRHQLFPGADEFTPQLVEQLDNAETLICPQLVDELANNLVQSLGVDIFAIPWGHYRYLIDKYKESPSTVLFYVHKTIF